MLLDKKDVRKNKAIRKIQSTDRKINRDRGIDRGSVVKKNIEKMVSLLTEEVIGNYNSIEKKALQVSTSDELIKLIDDCGLTGMSGSGFSTVTKLKAFISCKKDNKTIIINAAECEPGLLHDQWIVRHFIDEIQEASLVLKTLLPADKVILAVRGKTECQPITKPHALELERVPYKYPMGEEHILINQLLNIQLDSGSKPTDSGVLVLNVQTVYQIWKILNSCYDKGHFVTLADLKTGNAKVAYVNENTNIISTLNSAFGSTQGICFAGHGIFASDEINDSTNFSNTTSFACVTDTVNVSNDNLCRKCGGCSKKCPMGVSVKDIVLAKEQNPDADISKFGSEKCIHCATCAYFCPAQKNPMLYMPLD